MLPAWLREPADAFRDAFASRDLRRLELAFAGSVAGDWCFNLALAVYAYQQDGAKADIETGEEVEGDDRGGGEVDVEQAGLEEPDAVADVGAAKVVVAFLDAQRVDVDADAAGAEVFGGGDDDAAVAAAEVIDHVVGADPCESEDRGDDGIGGRHVRDVPRRGRAVQAEAPGVDLNVGAHRELGIFAEEGF